MRHVRGFTALTLLVVAVLTGSARSATAQAGPGTTHVTFWRGDLRIFATRDDTEITLLDITTGMPLAPATWSGNFATNPFVLDTAGDSFEASSLGLTHRVRVVADTARGRREDKPIVVWTGQVDVTLRHPAAPPPDQNAWMSYIPDMYQAGARFGSEIGTQFLGFTTRDLWIIVQAGAAPVQVDIQDLATNTDADTDDTATLDETSPEVVYRDGEITAFHLDTFEDDTVLISTSHPASVLAGISSTAFPDWSTTPPSYRTEEAGRELGTLFYTFASRWLTIMPVLDDTTVRITDLSDGDDTWTVNLANGDRLNPLYDIYVADPLGRTNQMAIGRAANPSVSFALPPGGPIDDDLIRIESDRPVLVQVGPIASDTNEFADVAYSVPTGPTSQLILAYSQNGGAEDFQVFSFEQANQIAITSLTATQGFLGGVNHDHGIPAPTPFLGGNVITSDWFWSSPTWSGELLRVEADFPVQVMAGDYDAPNFGAFIPYVTANATIPPRADAGPDRDPCPDQEVTLDGSGSFDGDFVPGGGVESWEWDLDVFRDSSGNGVPDDDVDATGPTVTRTFPLGTTTVKLTYTDDDGETSVDFVTIVVEDVTPPIPSCPALVQALADTLSGGTASPMAMAWDDCDPNPVITNDRTGGGADATDTYPCGLTRVVFTATDAHGNSTSCETLVALRPDRLSPAVGPFLRVTRTTADEPVLDWTLAGVPPADAEYVVLRTADGRAATLAPWRGPLTVQTETDDAPSGQLILYDVRAVQCDGQLSAD